MGRLWSALSYRHWPCGCSWPDGAALGVVFASMLAKRWQGRQPSVAQSATVVPKTETVILDTDSMRCSHCQAAVRRTLQHVAEVAADHAWHSRFGSGVGVREALE